MKNEESNTGLKLSYLLIGGGIGAILALLFAPQSGEDFRTEIGNATRKGLGKTEEIAGQFGETVQTVYQEAKTKADELYNSAKQQINSAATVASEVQENLQNAVENKVEQISAGIEAGKKEYDREGKILHNQAAATSNG